MKNFIKILVLPVLLVMAMPVFANDPEEIDSDDAYVSEDVIEACQMEADDLGLEDDEWSQHVEDCIDSSLNE